MQILEDAVRKAQYLFLNVNDEFQMDFCQKTKHYFLSNPKASTCHILESVLISDKEFTGKKITDISGVLNKNSKWILGFCHGQQNKNPKFKNDSYLDGYKYGLNFRK